VTLKPELGVTQGHQNQHGSIRHVWLPINVIATMGLSRTVSEINGDFSQKSQNFPNPVYFAPLWRGSLGIGYWRSGS